MDFRGQNGAVYIQTYTQWDTPLFSENKNVRQAKLYIQDMGRSDFDVKYLLVVTWYQARQYPYDYEWYEEFNDESYYWDPRFAFWNYESRLENVQRVSTVNKHTHSRQNGLIVTFWTAKRLFSLLTYILIQETWIVLFFLLCFSSDSSTLR